MWRPPDFQNPYGNEWFTSSCRHQYSLGEAYETGYNDALEALFKLARESPTGTFIIDAKVYNC